MSLVSLIGQHAATLHGTVEREENEKAEEEEEKEEETANRKKMAATCYTFPSRLLTIRVARGAIYRWNNLYGPPG